MDFVLTVHLDNLSGDPEHEVARILRYWAGELKNADLSASGAHTNVYDSSYKKVGCWDIVGASGECATHPNHPEAHPREVVTGPSDAEASK